MLIVAAKDFTGLHGQTAVGKLLTVLGANMPATAVEKLATLSKKELEPMSATGTNYRMVEKSRTRLQDHEIPQAFPGEKPERESGPVTPSIAGVPA